MKRLRRLSTVLVAGACVIAGIAIGLAIPRAARVTPPRADETGRLDRSTAPSAGRNMYSPDLRHDPYVRQEQLKLVDMLEQQCRMTKENCALAKASRAALTKE